MYKDVSRPKLNTELFEPNLRRAIKNNTVLYGLEETAQHSNSDLFKNPYGAAGNDSLITISQPCRLKNHPPNLLAAAMIFYILDPQL